MVNMCEFRGKLIYKGTVVDLYECKITDSPICHTGKCYGEKTYLRGTGNICIVDKNTYENYAQAANKFKGI